VAGLVLALGPGCGIRSLLSPEGNDEIPGPTAVSAGDLVDGGLGPACGEGRPCDPDNLGGETCSSLGAGSGRLGCDPETCTFDTSMCTDGIQGMAGTGGGPPIFGGGGDGGPGFFGPTPDGGVPGFFGNPPPGNPGEDGGTDPADGAVPPPPPFFGGFGGGADAGGGFFGGGFFGGG
jgi:hypothetical protein